MPAPHSADQGQSVSKTHLKWDVFVTPSIHVVTTDFAPGEHERPWPPISSTLVYGVRDAVLVDCFITVEQARAQADWIAAKGKNLTTIYATHGHGDHFFGASVLLERFPKSRFVAAPSAVQVMKEQVSPEYVAKFWESRFPNQLPKQLVTAEELRTNLLELEGESLFVVPLGFTDTAGTTCLHVPSLELIAAGDAAYNGVHPRLLESNQNQKRDEWLAVLDKMESLKPRTVVAGHKNMKNDDDGNRTLQVIGEDIKMTKSLPLTHDVGDFSPLRFRIVASWSAVVRQYSGRLLKRGCCNIVTATLLARDSSVLLARTPLPLGSSQR